MENSLSSYASPQQEDSVGFASGLAFLLPAAQSEPGGLEGKTRRLSFSKVFRCQSRLLWPELLLQGREKEITGILEKSAHLYMLIFKVETEGKYLFHSIDLIGLEILFVLDTTAYPQSYTAM